MCGLAPEVTFGELYQLTTKRFVCCVTDLSNCECIYIDHSTHHAYRCATACTCR